MSTGFNLHWDPPSNSSINGEFLGYILTVRPKDDDVKKIIEVKDESLEPQNFSLSGLLPHTTYILTLAAKNLEGLGPEAVIELRTETEGEKTNNELGNNKNLLHSTTTAKTDKNTGSFKQKYKSQVEVSSCKLMLSVSYFFCLQ